MILPMNQASRLKKQISSQAEASSVERERKPLRRFPGPQDRQFYSIITLLIISLLALLLYFLLPLFSFQLADTALVYGLVSLGLFACLHPWLELFLERRFHPERFLYRQLVEDYGRVVRQTSDLDTLLPYVGSTLVTALHLQGVTIWLYQPEDGLLVLAHVEGTLAVEDLVELPLDLPQGQLLGTQPVLALPESALRQGLLLLGVETVAALSLRDELVGLIGLGQGVQSQSRRPELLQVLDWMTAQLALAIKNARLIAELAETLDKLQLAYRRTIDAQEEERRNLAVELHDDILSRLTTMGMTLSNSQRNLTGDPARLQSCLELLGQETRYLNGRLREITQGLHPAVLADLGLIAALQAYMDSLSKLALPASAPRTIDLTAQGFDGTRIDDPKLERDLYYITRQALDNAIKHAQAEQVFIHLRWRDDAVTVTVQDTGVGLKATPELLMGQQGHLGLLSLHERVLAWRGRLSFQTGPGQGTTVYARLPIHQPSPNPTHLQAFTHYLRSRE
jgi:signal transduction histidine kinase